MLCNPKALYCVTFENVADILGLLNQSSPVEEANSLFLIKRKFFFIHKSYSVVMLSNGFE